MSNTLKTPQIAANGFVGYGGTWFPHVDRRPVVLSRNNSRDTAYQVSPGIVARPADGFGVGLGFKGFSQSGSDTRQRVDAALAEFLRCACLITCTLLIPRYKNTSKLAVLVPLQVIPKTGKNKIALKTSASQ